MYLVFGWDSGMCHGLGSYVGQINNIDELDDLTVDVYSYANDKCPLKMSVTSCFSTIQVLNTKNNKWIEFRTDANYEELLNDLSNWVPLVPKGVYCE